MKRNNKKRFHFCPERGKIYCQLGSVFCLTNRKSTDQTDFFSQKAKIRLQETSTSALFSSLASSPQRDDGKSYITGWRYRQPVSSSKYADFSVLLFVRRNCFVSIQNWQLPPADLFFAGHHFFRFSIHVNANTRKSKANDNVQNAEKILELP